MEDTSLIKAFVEQGALGLLCLGEGFAVVALWRRLNTVTEARITEGQKLIQIAEQVTSALDRLTDTVLRKP